MKLLDTTFLIDVLRKRESAGRVVAAMEAAGERGAAAEISAFELLVGVYRRGRIDRDRMAGVETVLRGVDVLPLNRAGAARAAEVLARLRAEGKDIGLLDALIAGAGLAAGCDTIVTRDEAFRRVPGLKVQTY